MYATVCKEFTFDAAHQLPMHQGKCRRLHGHTYRVQVFLYGRVKSSGTPDEGMVTDFSEISEVFKRCIESVCDHQLLNTVLPTLPPTAEKIAGWILLTLHQELPLVRKVRVYETPTSYAEVDITDLEEGGANVAAPVPDH